MDPNPPWLKEGYQRNHGSCSEQFATSFATMMSTHCAHNAPPTQPSNGLSLPLRMILNHSSRKCVHQIDISVRCIDEMQKGSLLQIQFYCQPLCISGVRAAMPDKRVAWSRLLLGFFERRQKAGARLWLMSPSFLPNHRAPNSLFSCARVPILIMRTPCAQCPSSYSHSQKS